jgi:ribonuclease-3
MKPSVITSTTSGLSSSGMPFCNSSSPNTFSIFTEPLFHRFPTFAEGQLTKMRSRLVSREGLMVHAISIGLGDYLMMGKGEESSGGRLRASALADAFEALIGAMFLDSNLETVCRFILREAEPDIQNLIHEPVNVNPKGRLQELLQALSPKSPVYSIISQSGPEHLKHFESVVRWQDSVLGSGIGKSKKEAEVAAAIDALKNERWHGGNHFANNPPGSANNPQ